MNVGDIYYTDSDEALVLANSEPDERGRYVWKGVTDGDYRVISVDDLNNKPKNPVDIVVLLDRNGFVWPDRHDNSEPIQDLAVRWDREYPKSAPHKVAIFQFKEWA